ncbi:MAG: Maf family protein [Kiloniellales bacterium]
MSEATAGAARLAAATDAPPLVLASASRSRAALLKNAGLAFAQDAARVDESAVKAALLAEGASPARAAETLSELKAQRVSPRHAGALVVGADQMLECEGRWFDKAAERGEAAANLRALSGKTHRLVSAVCLVRDGARLWHHVAEARLTVRPLSDDFIAAYLDAIGDAALDSVGAYQIEGLGAQLFSRIEGDPFTIMGLPLLPLLDFLRNHRVVPT